ncbi:hypothetical protein PSTT_10304, partial [Puccinia striiformis]
MIRCYSNHKPLSILRRYASIPPQQQTQQKQSIINQYRLRKQSEFQARNRSLLLYAMSIGVVTWIIVCSRPIIQSFLFDGTGKFAPDRIDKPIGLKNITVRFNADKSDTLNWKFWPCQKSVIVKPGETVLAFFKAKNLSDHDILGVAPYFAKVECFCFDEQKLLAGEEVDLPIFFFIDKDFVEDPLMKDIDDIVLKLYILVDEAKFIWLFRTRYPYDPNNNNQKLVDLNPPPNHHQQRLSRTDKPTTTTTDSTSHTITK